MIYLGDNKIGTIYSGENKIDKIYKGEELVYSSGPPSYYVLATDADFSGTVNGKFKYIGSDDYIIVPKIIKGITITKMGYTWWSGTTQRYQEESMFARGRIKGVALEEGNSVTNMTYMFYSTRGVELELKYFDTSNVTIMSYMFEGSKATTLDLSSFNTSNVTNMNDMFRSSSATTLDLSNFDTSNVTNMASMFYGSKATTLDLSSFDTSKVTRMYVMFENSRATSLDLSSFDTSKVTNMNDMFKNSRATTGYARTQADANRFNATTNKPSELTFVVK